MIEQTHPAHGPNDLPGTVADIEEIEIEAWGDWYAAAPETFAKDVGLSVRRSNGFASFALRKSPMTLYNRTLGMGVSHRVDKSVVAETIAWQQDHCGPAWAFALAAGALPDELPDWFEEKGLMRQTSGIAKFRRLAVTPVKDVDCPYDVRLVDSAHAGDFGVTARQGLGMGEGFDMWVAALCGRPHWRTYVAYDGSKPVGAGAMFVRNGLAWFGIGSTLPAYRTRGVQGALLARRISDAAALGPNLLTIETFHAGIGEAPNGSYRNVIRAGFSLAYFRPQYVSS